MNHDPSLTSPAQAGGPSNANNPPRRGQPSVSNNDGGSPPAPQPPSLYPQRRRKRKTRKKRPPKKKLTFTTHLLQNLDTIVFAELSAMYYMECSLVRFFIRAATQFLYLSPKDNAFPFLMPAGRMHLILILVPNAWCILVHLFASLPVGPEYHRGYQQGGLIIDFIGQKPPTSRLYYILADLVLLVLQCLMLAIHTEREKLRLALKTFRPAAGGPAGALEIGRTLEELDAEEQGIRSGPSVIEGEDEQGDIEMRPVRSSTGDTATSQTAPGSPGSGDEPSKSHLNDLYNSGNAIIGEYHVLNAMRVAASDVERSAATSLQSISYRATLAALEAQRRGVTVPGQTTQTEPPGNAGGV